jgi:hypothetical protein
MFTDCKQDRDSITPIIQNYVETVCYPVSETASHNIQGCIYISYVCDCPAQLPRLIILQGCAFLSNKYFVTALSLSLSLSLSL